MATCPQRRVTVGVLFSVLLKELLIKTVNLRTVLIFQNLGCCLKKMSLLFQPSAWSFMSLFEHELFSLSKSEVNSRFVL